MLAQQVAIIHKGVSVLALSEQRQLHTLRIRYLLFGARFRSASYHSLAWPQVSTLLHPSSQDQRSIAMRLYLYQLPSAPYSTLRSSRTSMLCLWSRTASLWRLYCRFLVPIRSTPHNNSRGPLQLLLSDQMLIVRTPRDLGTTRTDMPIALYSTAVIDLSQNDLILTVPNISDGRYWVEAALSRLQCA